MNNSKLIFVIFVFFIVNCKADTCDLSCRFLDGKCWYIYSGMTTVLSDPYIVQTLKYKGVDLDDMLYNIHDFYGHREKYTQFCSTCCSSERSIFGGAVCKDALFQENQLEAYGIPHFGMQPLECTEISSELDGIMLSNFKIYESQICYSTDYSLLPICNVAINDFKKKAIKVKFAQRFKRLKKELRKSRKRLLKSKRKGNK